MSSLKLVETTLYLKTLLQIALPTEDCDKHKMRGENLLSLLNVTPMFFFVQHSFEEVGSTRPVKH
jgi:hypothetical protein